MAVLPLVGDTEVTVNVGAVVSPAVTVAVANDTVPEAELSTRFPAVYKMSGVESAVVA